VRLSSSGSFRCGCAEPSRAGETMPSYTVTVATGSQWFAGTDDYVYLSLEGTAGCSERHLLDKPFYNDFERGAVSPAGWGGPSSRPTGGLHRVRARRAEGGGASAAPHPLPGPAPRGTAAEPCFPFLVLLSVCRCSGVGHRDPGARCHPRPPIIQIPGLGAGHGCSRSSRVVGPFGFGLQ